MNANGIDEDIEYRRAMADARKFAREHRARIDAEWDDIPTPPLTIEQHIEHARHLLRRECSKERSNG